MVDSCLHESRKLPQVTRFKYLQSWAFSFLDILNEYRMHAEIDKNVSDVSSKKLKKVSVRKSTQIKSLQHHTRLSLCRIVIIIMMIIIINLQLI
jgi:hypothetical protein